MDIGMTTTATPDVTPYKPIFTFWHKLIMISSMIIVGLVLVGAFIDVNFRPSPNPDLSPEQLARDAATTERASAFVLALGFEPGPVVRRALDSGSAYCTVRVAGSDKTFSLWCTRWHPTCIENMLKA
jgi:hypothetical protein